MDCLDIFHDCCDIYDDMIKKKDVPAIRKIIACILLLGCACLVIIAIRL